MALSKQALIAGGLALMAVSALGCKGNRSELPPVHVFTNMDFQQYFEAQERNDVFDDHRAMRPQIEGVVAFGQKSTKMDPHLLKADSHMYTGRDAGGKYVDALPKQLEAGLKDGSLLARGEARYNIYCAVCHGETGRGDGMAVRKAGAFKVNPPSYHQKKYQPSQLGYFYKVINEGQGTMLGYGAQIPVEDRWAIAAWVRTLQKHGREQGWDDSPAAAAPAKKDAPKKEGN